MVSDNKEDLNQTILYAHFIGELKFRESLYAELLLNIAQDIVFNELRTKRSFGYIAQFSIFRNASDSFVHILLNGSNF